MFDMLRENRGFREKDATLIVTCISRRLVEMGAGCRSNTEPEILKEALSSTQVIGFLAYGELSFTHLLQEPYVYNFSCWGTTLRSVIDGKEEANPEEAIGTRLRETSHQRMGAGERIENVTSGIKREDSAARALPKSKTAAEAPQGVPGHVATGYADLDRLLRGGIPENYTVALTAPSCDERELLVKSFLETGVRKGEVTFYLIVDPGDAESLTKEAHSNFHLFICNPQADSMTKSLTNVTKLKGVENLTEISIALTSAIRKLDKPLRNQRRFCIGITSDVLLQHRAVQTRRWLTGLIPELRSAGFTSLAVIDPQMHPFDELHAILGVFEGEINVYEKESDKGLGKYVKIKKMINQRYVKDELCLAKEDLQNEIKRAKRGYPL